MVYQNFDIETYARSLMAASGISRQAGFRHMNNAFKTGGPRVYDPRAKRSRKDNGIRFIKNFRPKDKLYVHRP